MVKNDLPNDQSMKYVRLSERFCPNVLCQCQDLGKLSNTSAEPHPVAVSGMLKNIMMFSVK